MKEEIVQIVQTYEQAKEDQKEVEKQEVQQKEKACFLKKNYVKKRLPEDKDYFLWTQFEGEKQRFMRLSMDGRSGCPVKDYPVGDPEIRNEKTT